MSILQEKVLSSSKKVRSRAVDPLQNVMKAIEDRDFTKLKSLLARDSSWLGLFQERLSSPRLPKDQSPLVAAILSDTLQIFTYILDEFQPNLEQETSAMIEGGHPVEGATPLWTASTLGRMKFVKLLVEKGADIEHTTDSKSSPLRGAAFDGHCDICEYLIENGADIDKPNQVGQSPLTIAAAMQKRECVQLLIDKGADVNHKGHNGDTPLHVSVESGAVEITKLLVDKGAKNDPNDVGFTPAILACCYGHSEVLDFLKTEFSMKPKEQYDCHCLLAAKEVLGSNDTLAEHWMKKAVTIRRSNPEDFVDFPTANKIYDSIQEPVTDAEVDSIMADETRMFFVSSIFCERILGRVHPTTAFYIRISGDMVLAEDRYEKCIELWQRSLDFDDAARMAYELQITEDLLFAIRGFAIMANNNFIPPVESHFRWGLKEFRLAHESKISEVSVVSCLFRMLAVWIKVAESIKDVTQCKEEKERILIAVTDLIKAMKGRSCPLLIACLQNIPENNRGAGQDIVTYKLPLHKVIALLLDEGCSVHCEDEHGNFPLHLAVQLLEDTAPNCIKTLLEYGSHFDAVNFNSETPLDVAMKLENESSSSSPRPVPGVLEQLNRAAVVHMSLQCLASRVLVKHGIDYISVLPKRVIKVVSWHEGDSTNVEVSLDSNVQGFTPTQCTDTSTTVNGFGHGVLAIHAGDIVGLPSDFSTHEPRTQ